jgi:hypothetical protein
MIFSLGMAENGGENGGEWRIFIRRHSKVARLKPNGGDPSIGPLNGGPNGGDRRPIFGFTRH